MYHICGDDKCSHVFCLRTSKSLSVGVFDYMISVVVFLGWFMHVYSVYFYNFYYNLIIYMFIINLVMFLAFLKIMNFYVKCY